MDVRSIITEALSRANIVPRRQTAPGYLMEDGLKLLQGIVAKYNNDNYLAFTHSQINLPSHRSIHIYDQVDTLKGDYNLYFDSEDELSSYELSADDVTNNVWAFLNDGRHDTVVYTVLAIAVPGGETYTWVGHPQQEYNARYQDMLKYAKSYHIQVPNVAKLNTLNVNRGANVPMLKLNFQPHAEFCSVVPDNLYWTYTELAQGEWLVETKPYVATGCNKLTLEYNKGFYVDLDDDLRIPDAYVELLTVALTHKLALKYPRLDDAHMSRLENDVSIMIANVMTPKADAIQIKRDSCDASGYTAHDVMAGRMFWGI